MEKINIKELKVLIEEYRKGEVEVGDHILSVEFSDNGTGSITERRITGVTEGKVSYKERSYDYELVATSTKSSEQRRPMDARNHHDCDNGPNVRM